MQTPDQDLRDGTRAISTDPVCDLQEYWGRLKSIYEEIVEPAAFDGSLEQRTLEAFKRLPQAVNVIDRYRAGLRHLDTLELAAIESYGDELPRPVTEAHLLFSHQNALTDFAGAFAKASEQNSVIAEGLERYRDNPSLPGPCLLAFSDQQYRLLYTAFDFGWVRDEDHPNLDQVFRLRGMEYLGKIACASGEPDAESEDKSPRKVWLEIRKRRPLLELRNAAASDHKASLTEDVVQYLFIVQEAAAAGALDPANAGDSDLAKYASVIIGNLIDEFGGSDTAEGTVYKSG
jgi:hypothetical protein